MFSIQIGDGLTHVSIVLYVYSTKENGPRFVKTGTAGMEGIREWGAY
jgi:hypothetical protein